ncbi:glycoside hydrolase family 18 protein [Micromonospora sp. M12]
MAACARWRTEQALLAGLPGARQQRPVSIAVGGWNDGNDSAFEALAANSGSRTTFVNNLVNFVNQYNLDGVDMDWEYPDPGASANNYTALMTQLGSAMHSRGKLLTAAVVSEGGSVQGVQTAVFNQVDWLNIMAYDGGSRTPTTTGRSTASTSGRPVACRPARPSSGSRSTAVPATSPTRRLSRWTRPTPTGTAPPPVARSSATTASRR